MRATCSSIFVHVFEYPQTAPTSSGGNISGIRSEEPKVCCPDSNYWMGEKSSNSPENGKEVDGSLERLTATQSFAENKPCSSTCDQKPVSPDVLEKEIEQRVQAEVARRVEEEVARRLQGCIPSKTSESKNRAPLHVNPNATRARACPTVAEQVLKFQKRTPPRFRTAPRASSTPRPQPASARLTSMPPPPPVPNPKNSVKIAAGRPSVSSRPPTVFKPFRLSQAPPSRSASLAPPPPTPVPFRATPLNRRMLESSGEIGVPRVEKRQSTVPQDFAFMKRRLDQQQQAHPQDQPQQRAPAKRPLPSPMTPSKRPRLFRPNTPNPTSRPDAKPAPVS